MTDSASAPSIPASGARTSEGILTLLVTLLAAAQYTPIVEGIPPLYKVISMALAALTVLGYQAQRTSLKRAHLAIAAGAILPAQTTSKLPGANTATTAIVLGIVLGLGASGLALGGSGCSGATSAAHTVGNAAGSAASSWVQCEGVNLEQDVGGSSLIATVAVDLASGNYVKLIADLIATLGGQAVGCAVLAIDDLDSTTAGIGSGSAAPALALIPLRLAHARDLEGKYGWRRMPPTNVRSVAP